MRRIGWALLVLSLLAVALLVQRGGIAAIFSMLGRAGWLLALLLPVHAAALLLDVLGWPRLIPAPPPVRELFAIACVREAINRLLPVANVGGEVAGVRLLSGRGVPLDAAASSVIVETLLAVVAQLLFVIVGALCLAQAVDAGPLAGRMLWGLAASLSAMLLGIALVRDGTLFRWAGRLAQRATGSEAGKLRADGPPGGEGASRGPEGIRERAATRRAARGGGAGGGLLDLFAAGASLERAVRALLNSPALCASVIGWQLASLAAGCVETWLVLAWFGHPVGIGAALSLESAAQAVRHFLFVVPAGLGVQEAGLIAIGHVLGLDMSVTVALSLAKRARELAYGLPALALWPWLEARRV